MALVLTHTSPINISCMHFSTRMQELTNNLNSSRSMHLGAAVETTHVVVHLSGTSCVTITLLSCKLTGEEVEGAKQQPRLGRRLARTAVSQGAGGSKVHPSK